MRSSNIRGSKKGYHGVRRSEEDYDDSGDEEEMALPATLPTTLPVPVAAPLGLADGQQFVGTRAAPMVPQAAAGMVATGTMATGALPEGFSMEATYGGPSAKQLADEALQRAFQKTTNMLD